MMHKAWCSLPWRHNGRDSVSNHQPHDYLLNRLFRRRSKKTSKLGITGLCAGNSPGTGEFSAQMASYAEMFPFDDVIMCLGEVPYHFSRPPIKFRGHTAKKNRRFSGLQLQFEFTNGYEMMHKAWSSIEEVPYCCSMSSIKFQGRW